ncbi:hypothetical protein I552_5081 [Mycobacterium xenopi 3993]|nr:hypothetical protein I552_5081 [Mycobacterium xenopi 3993]
MATGLPSQTEVIELLDGEFARAGYEIEDVVIDTRRRPPRIMVIADGDEPLDLDTITALSRAASRLLDGVDRIRVNTCWRSVRPGGPAADQRETLPPARGRKVHLTLTDGSQLVGRVGETRGDTIRLVVRDDRNRDWTVRELALDEIAKAVVQVEFSPPAQRELELATTGGCAGTEAAT